MYTILFYKMQEKLSDKIRHIFVEYYFPFNKEIVTLNYYLLLLSLLIIIYIPLILSSFYAL